MSDTNDTINLTREEATVLLHCLRFLQRLDSEGGNFAFIGDQRELVADICRKVEGR